MVNMHRSACGEERSASNGGDGEAETEELVSTGERIEDCRETAEEEEKRRRRKGVNTIFLSSSKEGGRLAAIGWGVNRCIQDARIAQPIQRFVICSPVRFVLARQAS